MEEGTPQNDAKKDNSNHITVKLQRQKEHDVYFRIKRDVPLRRLMEAYCVRLSLQYREMRFLLDGSRIKEENTADELGMEDGDSIDVMNEQLGGSIV